MPALRLAHLLALVAIALVALSSAPIRANALVADRPDAARYARAHDAVARHKRSDSAGATGRCIPRSPSSAPPAPSSTPSAAPSSAPPAPSTTPSSAPPPPSNTPSSTPPPPSTTSSPTYTSSSPAPSPTTSASSGGGQRKWCLAWGGADDQQSLEKFALPDVGYLYDWSEYVPSGLPNGIQGMPMLWGYKNVDAFNQLVQSGYNYKYALGMNEPNEPSQSNMSPQDAFNMWMTYINPLAKQGVTLVSPACTNSPSGRDWMNLFMQLCTVAAGCHVDILAFHAYTVNSIDLINFAQELNGNYSLPVAVTEFACQNFVDLNAQASMSQVWDFAGQVRGFVDSTSWLVMACPFGAVTDIQNVNPDNSLMNGDGTPNALGYFYLDQN